MRQAGYIFDRTQHTREKNRLMALEAVHDSSTKRRLLASGLGDRWRCLEVGPGTGSVMRWIARRVGRKGQVVALDLNPRFIRDTRHKNVEVRQGDICREVSPPNSFDLVHCRHVLIHTAHPERAIRNMFRSLKPGGRIVIEEPDFLASRAITGTLKGCQAVNRVNMAILAMFQHMGRDPGFGSRLPSLLYPYRLRQFVIENDVPIALGRSPMAKLMSMSAQQLEDQYIATGLVSSQDIRRYRQFTENRKSWAIYYATVAVLGARA